MKDVGEVRVFSTAPQSSDHSAEEYRRRVACVARWSETHGCEGILVYTDNRIVDPWLVAQVIIQNSIHLAPLVAVQPAYMHPYSAAKMITSLAYLYGRRLHLNMVAGGFTNDLAALGEATPHDRRYDRLIEYTTIMLNLLKGDLPVTFEGEFYRVNNLKLAPALDPVLMPRIFVSGSSEAGRHAAEMLGAIVVEYPKPASEMTSTAVTVPCGIRVGIVARESAAEAWSAARARFPEDRKGQLKHQIAMTASDSSWHRQLSELAADDTPENPYWLVPFQNYGTFCPYLVGSYETVAVEIGRYIALGYTNFIVDIPQDAAEVAAIECVFELAKAGCMQ